MVNETSIIDKYLRSRLTFDVLAKVTDIGLPPIHYMFLSSHKAIELKFHEKPH